MPIIWANFVREYVSKSFQKYPNLVTLLSSHIVELDIVLTQWYEIIFSLPKSQLKITFFLLKLSVLQSLKEAVSLCVLLSLWVILPPLMRHEELGKSGGGGVSYVDYFFSSSK